MVFSFSLMYGAVPSEFSASSVIAHKQVELRGVEAELDALQQELGFKQASGREVSDAEVIQLESLSSRVAELNKELTDLITAEQMQPVFAVSTKPQEAIMPELESVIRQKEQELVSANYDLRQLQAELSGPNPSFDEMINQAKLESIIEDLQQQISKLRTKFLLAQPQQAPVAIKPPMTIADIIEQQTPPGVDELTQKEYVIFYPANQVINVPHYGISMPKLLHNVTIHFEPTLQQGRVSGVNTNYCGYYAIFNAVQMAGATFPLGAVQPNSANRQAFLKLFEHWLALVQEYRKSHPSEVAQQGLSLISYDELNNIMGKDNLKIPFAPLLVLLWNKNESFDKIAIRYTDYFAPLFNFSKIRRPKTVTFIGSSLSTDGHYFAMRADKDDKGDLNLYVTDSLHTPQWYQDEYHIITRILPYVFILMDQWDQAKDKIFDIIGTK